MIKRREQRIALRCHWNLGNLGLRSDVASKTSARHLGASKSPFDDVERQVELEVQQRIQI
jgi:hypothetical protein